MYLISYKISSAEIQGKFIDSINALGESVALYPNAKILDSHVDIDDIFTSLYKIIEPSDQFIVIPFELENIQGFINSNVLSWMRERSAHSETIR